MPDCGWCDADIVHEDTCTSPFREEHPEIVKLRKERDEARNAAYLLAHACTHDSRPLARTVSQALAYGPQKLVEQQPRGKR